MERPIVPPIELTAPPESGHCRWIVVATYCAAAGPYEVEFHIEELEDLHVLIERGPHFDCVVEIRIVINPKRVNYPGLTVEKSLAL
jgi:hypothetical protein